MADITYIRLSELNARISKAIHTAFHAASFWVIGDITNHSFREQKNSHNFELIEKDPDSTGILARISGRAWSEGSVRIASFESITGQKFTNNINVLILVSVQYHPVYGLQLTLLDIDPNFTLGALERQRRTTLERLIAENPAFINKRDDRYITRNNQLKLNAVIQKIAVISSKTSAGGEDFKHTLLNNTHGYTFFIDDYHALVQGDANADQFLEKIIDVFNSGTAYDAVVITRGGGAQTDFLIFDSYKIARAVAKFPIPVITGIGHQKNESLTDLMAHTQTKTPTQAAEFILAHNRRYEEGLLFFQKSIVIKSQQLFSRHFHSLASLNSVIVNNSRNILIQNKDKLAGIHQLTIRLSHSVIFNHRTALMNISSRLGSRPRIIVNNKLNDMQNMVIRIKTFKNQYLKNQAGYLNHCRSVIKMMSPDNILNKGFAIVKVNNKITGNPDEIAVGKDIDIILSGTQIKSTVKQKAKYHGKDFDL